MIVESILQHITENIAELSKYYRNNKIHITENIAEISKYCMYIYIYILCHNIHYTTLAAIIKQLT